MKPTYSKFLEINPNFESVVDIDADKRHPELWKEYIVGPDMEKFMDKICLSLGNEQVDARRSFWLNGSYGTGKSYAGILLKHLLEDPPEVVENFLAKNNRLAQFKNRFMKCRRNGAYLVVWKTGCIGLRTDDMLLIEATKAIQDALVEKFGDKAVLGANSLVGIVQKCLKDSRYNWDSIVKTTILSDDYPTAESLRTAVDSGDLKAIQAVAQVLRETMGAGLVNNLETFRAWVREVIEANGLTKTGIFLIWDEFTEYVAKADGHTVLQQLSEFSKEAAFFACFILHKTKELVASVGGEDSYQRIIDRFHEAEFHLSADASLDLIAGSIMKRTGMEQNWANVRQDVVDRLMKHRADLEIALGLDTRVMDMLDDLCPMHPMTIRLLSRVAENYAAEKRTMFRFMKDSANDSTGFAGYIHQYGPDDEASWLTPDWLWDYFFMGDSDFRDKDTKVAEYIRHYYEQQDLVKDSEEALVIFKVIMLLLAVNASVKGMFVRNRNRGGLPATLDSLELCLTGVMDKNRVDDLANTLADNKLIVLDTAANGDVRLELPFRGGADDFQIKYDANDKKYTRYQMWSKDGDFAKAFEEKAKDENDVLTKRIKFAACCNETNSIKMRLAEIKKELDRSPYKLGLLIVTVDSDLTAKSIQGSLKDILAETNEPRLTVALLHTPLTDDTRRKWLTAITKEDLAKESGNIGSANQYHSEAVTTLATWVSPAADGGKITAWNGENEWGNLHGLNHLRHTIRQNVFAKRFPYAPETVVETVTAYKPCKDGAALAGIRRETKDAQVKSVLAGLGGLQKCKGIDEMAATGGDPKSEAIAHLAQSIRHQMESGARVSLSDLWEKLAAPPFGYYDTVACGVLLGYVFSAYKNSEYSWTDSSQGTQVLNEANLAKMVLLMVKGKTTTDYLSRGSEDFQLFRGRIQKIMGLTENETAAETACWRNMREAVNKCGVPFWTLKYLQPESFDSPEMHHIAGEIAENIHRFIAEDENHENIIAEVNRLFSGRGKIKDSLALAWGDKASMKQAFRTFLFDASPELGEISQKLSIQPENLSDKLHSVMQDSIYTWTEEQVREKLPLVVAEYRYLSALGDAVGKTYRSMDMARQDLRNLFDFVRIPLTVLETLDKPWFPALREMYHIAFGGDSEPTDRGDMAAEFSSHGKEAMDFLKDNKPVLYEILAQKQLDFSPEEVNIVYDGLKNVRVNASIGMFQQALEAKTREIAQAQDRMKLKSKWEELSGQATVRDWCNIHGAPLLWVLPKDLRPAFATLARVQKGQTVPANDVVSALAAISAMDTAILKDDSLISEAMLKVVGEEYRDIFEQERKKVMFDAKAKLGNDMSIWDVSGLRVLQQILKREWQEKAKREKLSLAKNRVRTMNESDLRGAVQAFLEAHPEFCDDFQ